MKLLSFVSSAALALAMLIPATSAAQEQLVKRSSHLTPRAAAARQRVADVQAPLKKNFHEATKRMAAHSTPSLARAMNDAGTLRRAAAPRKAHAAAAALPNLCGMVTYQDGWTPSYSRPGVYKLFNDGSTELILNGPNGMGGTPVGDYYFVSSYESYYGSIFIDTYVYDMTTGTQYKSFTDMDNNYEKIIFDFATDPVSGTVYGLGYSHDATQMLLSVVTCDPDAGFTVTPVGTLPGNWNAIACSPEGQLYGINYQASGETVISSSLYKIDKTTAAVTKVGDTGYAPQYFSSATIDPRSGRMYWTVCPPDETGLLCEVDLATGAATELLQFSLNDEVQGLYVAAPEAEDGAPAAVEDLEA
ncbi:MAG: hypothetical protein K2F72_03480, partial [Muribaculaceae bacterium]|nr:hypothetical protein [Muribaculaceae bacterium]